MRSTTRNVRPSSDAVLQLWRQYKATGDQRAKDRLVLTLVPMVKYIVNKKIREVPARCETDDFLSCGIEALIWSIDRFDPAKSATLEQYAWTRIHGAVLDELRRNDWAPRPLRRWERDIYQARDRFTRLYGRAPTQEELADAVGVTPDKLRSILADVSKADVGSLNSLVQSDDGASIERIDTLASSDRDNDPEFATIRSVAVDRFRSSFLRLPEREQKVAVLLHVYGLTLREIGEVLGVSESRVCQINGSIKRRLRDQLGSEEPLFVELAA
jgi:RNA polymerase sigma factor FliA